MAIIKDDLMWLSGFLEGEGCFTYTSMKTTKRRYKYPKIEVRNTDKDVMARAQHLIGGRSLYEHRDKRFAGRAKLLYSATVSGPKALALMTDLYPYMGERRRNRIEELLFAWEHGHENSVDLAAR